MASAGTAFTPELYDRYLGPLLFEPYALDLAGRVEALRPDRVLETAAGTGIVTAAITHALPHAEIVATDLSAPMLAMASGRLGGSTVRFEPADAQALPFPDSSFDAVVCQFGAMFFPDRPLAYREALRVLRPGGRFLFNVWDRAEANPVADIVGSAVGSLFPDDPPTFLRRVPFGYFDEGRIEEDLRGAGFDVISVERLERRSAVASAADAAFGFCQGTPLRDEIEQRDASRLQEATDVATEALRAAGYDSRADSPLSALVIDAGRAR
jgi:SAM-dependent methyltransferase